MRKEAHSCAIIGGDLSGDSMSRVTSAFDSMLSYIESEKEPDGRYLSALETAFGRGETRQAMNEPSMPRLPDGLEYAFRLAKEVETESTR